MSFILLGCLYQMQYTGCILYKIYVNRTIEDNTNAHFLSFNFQVALTVSQIMWCRDVTEILESNEDRLQGMKDFEQKSFRELNELAALVRGVCLAFSNYHHERKWTTKTYVYMPVSLS